MSNASAVPVKRLLISAVIIIMVLSFAGCGVVMDRIVCREAEDFVIQSLDDFFGSNCKKDLNSLCNKRYDMSGISDDQLELFRYSMRNARYYIVDTRIKDDRSNAVCIVDFSGIPHANELPSEPMTEEGYKEAIDSLKKTGVRVTFRLVRDEDGNWMFSDLNDFYDSFLRPYDGLEYLDEQGVPVNIPEDYLIPYIVDNVWYDPVMGNPLNGSTLSSPSALVNVYYFNQKVTLDITAKLYKGNTEIASMDVALKDVIMVKLDFDAMVCIKDECFRDGSYHVELYSGDVKLARSSEITVR